MVFEIQIHELAEREIAALRAFDQRAILDAIEDQLRYQPTIATRRRKCLSGVLPSFEHVIPIWELRVGQFRVFYDANEVLRQVHVRAVRRKPPTTQTKDIL